MKFEKTYYTIIMRYGCNTTHGPQLNINRKIIKTRFNII